MQKIIKIMILSVLITYPGWAVAKNSNLIHTHTNTPIELEFVSANSSGIRVAAVCFLGMGDCGGGSFGKADEALPLDPALQCQNEGYVSTCAIGEVGDVACPYDPNFKTCKCNICDESYVYSLAETTAQGYVADGSCQSCEVVKYKRKDNPCSGYQTCECGGEIGASVCYTGSVKKFNNCKSCCENRCRLLSCPANHRCDYEACSGRYCDLGCAGGYVDICSLPDRCVGLGYKPQSCSGDGVSCPYDVSYKFCW